MTFIHENFVEWLLKHAEIIITDNHEFKWRIMVETYITKDFTTKEIFKYYVKLKDKTL